MTQTKAAGPDLDGCYDKSTWEHEGFTFHARVELDDAQDISHYGSIEWQEAPGSEKVDGRSGPVWIVPASEEDRKHDLQRLHDYVREYWQMVGIVVAASREGIELGHASLWGIEDDSGSAYLNEVAEELAEEAAIEARKALARLCGR